MQTEPENTSNFPLAIGQATPILNSTAGAREKEQKEYLRRLLQQFISETDLAIRDLRNQWDTQKKKYTRYKDLPKQPKNPLDVDGPYVLLDAYYSAYYLMVGWGSNSVMMHARRQHVRSQDVAGSIGVVRKRMRRQAWEPALDYSDIRVGRIWMLVHLLTWKPSEKHTMPFGRRVTQT